MIGSKPPGLEKIWRFAFAQEGTSDLQSINKLSILDNIKLYPNTKITNEEKI